MLHSVAHSVDVICHLSSNSSPPLEFDLSCTFVCSGHPIAQIELLISDASCLLICQEPRRNGV